MNEAATSTRGGRWALAGIAVWLFVTATSPGEPPAELPPLSQARDVGRTKSALLAAGRSVVPAGPPQANLAEFNKHVGPVLTRACTQCHGPDKTEGNIRIDTLDPDLLRGDDVKWWLEVFSVLSNGEMPPEDAKVQLSEVEIAKIVEWLSLEIQKASNERSDEGSTTSFRRMTRYEYNYALQDLLGLPHTFSEKLPPESASADGFKNSSQLLQMSAMQFQHYRDIGLKALQRATALGDRPPAVTYVISMAEQMAKVSPGKGLVDIKDKGFNGLRNRQHLVDREAGKAAQLPRGPWAPQPDGVASEAPPASSVFLALPRNSQLKLNLDRFLPDEGIMRVRIRAGRSTTRDNEYAALRLIFSAHTSNNANFSAVISPRDIPVTAAADKPQFIDFYIPLSQIQRNPFRKLARKFPRRDEFLHIQNVSNASNRKDPLHVLVDYIEITAPYYAQWPPRTHTDIFIESKTKATAKDNEQQYAREILTHFLNRAWRRPIGPREVEPFLALFAKHRSEFASFEAAVVEVLATVLATPEFLYVTQRGASDSTESRSISDSELAVRLSFFLWCSVPDEELLKLASEGKLKQPEVLDAQVRRMLADPRSERFFRHFVQQWLGLDGLNNVTHIRDEGLRDAMREEPIAFFRDALQRNRSVMDFIHSDYAVVNERLAAHYKIADVHGPHFRSVPIKPDDNRGGILTTAAVLSMNSDGKDSHPLKRGVWLLERILHDPPPPPPPNVPEVDLTDPRILQMTLKERIADHRNHAACMSCHAKIDPWGIAFENYDALGAFRTQIKQKPVDATAQLFNKQELAGITGLKRYLLTHRQDQFARAMVHKMTSFALGRELSFGDRTDIDELTIQFREGGDRLGDLVRLIIASDLFCAPGN